MRRVLSAAAALAFVLTPTLVVAGTQSAQATPVVGLDVLPGLELAGFEGVSGWGGMGSIGAAAAADAGYLAAASGVAVAGAAIGAAAVGYGIGWTGVQSYGFLKDKFFTDHPVAAAGSAGVLTWPGGQASNFVERCSAGVCYLDLDYSDVSQRGYRLVGRNAQGDYQGVPYAYYADLADTGGATRHISIGSNGNALTEAQAAANVTIAAVDYLGAQPSYVPKVSAPGGGYALNARVDCVNAAGAHVNVLQTGPVFHSASDAPAGSPSASCPAGYTAVGGGVDVQQTTSGSPTVQNIPGFAITPKPAWTDPANPHKDCLGLSGGTPCRLTPTETDPATGLPRPYDPKPNPSTGTVPGPSGCRWGPYTLTVKECGPEVASPPKVQPTTTPTVDATSPPIDAGHAPSADPSADASDCFPNGWAQKLNPIEWVMKPVECALVWAFVPSPSAVSDGIDGIRNQWNGSAPAQAAAAAHGTLAPFLGYGSADLSDCRGWRLDYDLPALPGQAAKHLGPIYPFQACGEPTITLSHLAVGLETAGILSGVLFLGARMIGSAFGVETPFSDAGGVPEPALMGAGGSDAGLARYRRRQGGGL